MYLKNSQLQLRRFLFLISSIAEKFSGSLEEGLIPEAAIFTRARSATSNNACKQVAQCAKIILYLLFVGLAGYAMWQTFSVNSMEFKVMNSIRESQSKGLLGQPSTLDKSARNTPGEFHQSKDISTTKNLEASELDGKTSFANENATDVYGTDDALSKTTESYEIYETDSEAVVNATTTTDESPIEDVDSNCSLAQQMNRFYEKYDEYLASDEMKLEREQEEILENYALLSLIVRNAVRKSQIVDSFIYYDNGDNWGDSAALNAQNSNGVEEENSEGTRETQETQESQEMFKLFINGGDYAEENSENSDYQIETVTESPAKDYGQFYRYVKFL